MTTFVTVVRGRKNDEVNCSVCFVLDYERPPQIVNNDDFGETMSEFWVEPGIMSSGDCGFNGFGTNRPIMSFAGQASQAPSPVWTQW